MKEKENPATPASQENSGEDAANNPQSTNEDANKPNGEGNDPYLNQKKRAEAAEKERDEANAKVAELKAALDSKADSKGEVSDIDLKALADKHDVSVELLEDLMGNITNQASKAAEKLVSDKLSEKEKEDQKKAILNDFKNSFDKLADSWDGVTLSEEAVRTHYLTNKAKNPNYTVSDSIEEIYGSFKQGKVTAEDDVRGADQAGESIDFDTLSRDPEKLQILLKDPKARKKYYDWRDKQGI